jgi:uncharacterized protein (TIGR03084 family)
MERNVMSLDYPRLLAELRHESQRLIEHLDRLTPEQWELSTPAAGWSIKDQVTHLAFFDDVAVLAMSDPSAFRVQADALVSGGMDFPDRIAAEYRGMASHNVHGWFIGARTELQGELEDREPKSRMAWFGPDMSVASNATARLMETWAHAHDVYDALGVEHPTSIGLRSIAHLGVSTFAFSHALHRLQIPAEPVRIELSSPFEETWSWGPEDATNRVTGAAVDFVLVVTQRRHWTETDLRVEGPVATGWLDIAQAYAGAASRRTPQAVIQ